MDQTEYIANTLMKMVLAMVARMKPKTSLAPIYMRQ
jgi:hypothetical protein